MNQYKFLRIYRDIAKGRCHEDDLTVLYWEMKSRLEKDSDVGHNFKRGKNISQLEMAFAIDAVAHNIHKQGKNFLDKVFPGGDVALFKRNLDELSGMESSSEVRKGNRGYYSSLLATDAIIFLEKSQVGMTTKDDIKDVIKEYEKYIKVGIATKAMILTVYRFYDGKKYRDLIKDKGLDKEDNEPLIVGGPASTVMIDKEGHLITANSLDKAFKEYMKNIWTRNMNVYHSDVQAGWCLPAYINSSGQVFKSGVNRNGLWVCAEVREDTRVAQRLAEMIIKGLIRSFSVGGSAIKTEWKKRGSQSFMQIDEMELQEITFCEEGVNPGAHFDILKSLDRFKKLVYDVDFLSKIMPKNDLLSGLTFWDGGRIMIKADRENSVTDQWILELQKCMPDDITIRVSEDIPEGAEQLLWRGDTEHQQQTKEAIIHKMDKNKKNIIKKESVSQLEQFINTFENEGYEEVEHLEDMADEKEIKTDKDVSQLEQFLDYIENNEISKAEEPHPKGEEEMADDREKKAKDLAIMMGMPQGAFKRERIMDNVTTLKEPKMGIDDKDAYRKLNEEGETESDYAGIDKDKE